ncbi:MAG: PEP-CTERM sorting domain-containing protein [Vitreoscilla sp.]
MKFGYALAAAALAVSGLANAATIDWNTWASNGAGSISTTSGPISVIYAGEMSGYYTDYPSWGPSATFADGTVVANAPVAANGIVRLIGGGGGSAVVDTITFSHAVVNPVFSIWSLGQGGDTASFSFIGATPVFVSGGPGAEYGGSSITVSGNDVIGTEGDGTVQFIGTFTSISWTNPVAENWYGFNVGVAGVAGVVPEPGSIGMLLAGLTLTGLALRRRNLG